MWLWEVCNEKKIYQNFEKLWLILFHELNMIEANEICLQKCVIDGWKGMEMGINETVIGWKMGYIKYCRCSLPKTTIYIYIYIWECPPWHTQLDLVRLFGIMDFYIKINGWFSTVYYNWVQPECSTKKEERKAYSWESQSPHSGFSINDVKLVVRLGSCVAVLRDIK